MTTPTTDCVTDLAGKVTCGTAPIELLHENTAVAPGL
eukprot:CAMPEP_0179126166 /NCGR_PEP_ID=MMETSP0796-20121207/59708_1 /TAXON_ID=73915 /ORGANISM="Pyrodinium bahamense, Strain pbaha01" /LENGTH=36 /DNA_ID= /DNA_START= /DNA_END= /DNA_ORIENTATION=